MMNYTLRQHGRATLDFLSSFGSSIGPLMKDQQEALDTAGLNDETLADDLDDRAKQIEGVLEKVPAFRTTNLVGEWHGEHHARTAAAAFEEIKDDLASDFENLASGGTTLSYNPDLDIPKYWPYPIHRTTGGWDGHRHMGFIHGELVHRYIVGKAAKPPAAGGKATDIYADRKNFAEQAPRRDYDHVVEIGCSSGPYTAKLAEVFPDAKISACDISIAQLEQAQRNGNLAGQSWNLFHADGCATGLDDESCDLFTSYIILHELPVKVIEDILREGFRTLKSGGDLLFGDVAPYSALSKTGAWRTDYMATYGGEPFWRGSSTMDMVGIMEDIGFVDVKYEGMAPNNYPWVTYGRKP
jgi:SAM-dependent methyltransferase